MIHELEIAALIMVIGSMSIFYRLGDLLKAITEWIEADAAERFPEQYEDEK